MRVIKHKWVRPKEGVKRKKTRRLAREHCPFCDQLLPASKKPRKIVRISEVALYLGCSAKTVERRTNEGKIKCLPRMVAGHRRYLKSEVDRYKKSLKKVSTRNEWYKSAQ